ncbi:glycoside hydrolase [Mycena vulgaris]|nr:glycoside hydrolase [Mycena vulgaris]
MTPLLSLLLLLGSTSARTALSVNGVDQGHGVGVRAITDLSSASMACNTGFVQPVSQTVIPVSAGSNVTAQFHHTSAGYVGPDPADPIDSTNKGPVIAYLIIAGLNWFKIGQSGLNPTTHQWGSDLLFINKGNTTFTIPSCLSSGDYLLRVEYIGLEFATTYPGAQFYMSCAQLSIAASGEKLVAPATVSIPGAYHATDPGIVTPIVGISSYTVPGPAVFTC